jgi:hypothetical protein
MFKYPCPDCSSTLEIHGLNCGHGGVSREAIESAYIDIISMLSIASVSKTTLKDNVNDWSDLHDACLSQLEATRRVRKHDGGCYKLLSPSERQQATRPTTDPLETIYEYGTVPGAHDNGIFALIAYFANQGLSWEQTKEEMHEWFERTGTWSRGGFDSHRTIDSVLEDKHHVWDEAYGWSDKGKAAQRVIEGHKKGSQHTSTDASSPPSSGIAS